MINNQLKCFRRCNVLFSKLQISTKNKNILSNSSFSTEENIIIPKKIQRGPTDILRALESTIGVDTTAAHYKYHDDPFLIPTSNTGKRAFAMSKEAGKKAAHFIRQHHPDLFQHKEADPYIESFAPLKFFDEQSDVTEKDLIDCIEKSLVSDSITVYNLCKSKSIELSNETLQSLLELLCYYNMDDSGSTEFIEERWFKQSAKKERQRKTWKDGSLAEEIFNNMEKADGVAYSALIQGMAKYYNVEKAWHLYEEAKQKGIPLNTSTYNSLIEISNFLKENYEMRWAFILQLLNQMNEAKIKPDIGTLNATLFCLSSMGESKTVKTNALKILNEFKNLDIEPSLTTWGFLLTIFCKERGPVSTILHDIMDLIEGKEFILRDIRDVNFFLNAMSICRYHLMDFSMAQRLNNLLYHGNNYDFIGDSYKESIYYRNYMILACASIPTDEFISEIYEKLVPHIYTPEPAVMEEILKQVEATDAIQHVPKLWSDMVIFDLSNRDRLLNLILNIMVNGKTNDESLQEQFGNVAYDIYNILVNQDENRTNKIPVTGEMLGNVLLLVAKNKDFDKAWNVFNLLEHNESIMGIVQADSIAELLNLCIENKMPTRGTICIQYCMEMGYQREAEELAEKMATQLTLNNDHITSLKKIVGEHVLAAKEV